MKTIKGKSRLYFLDNLKIYLTALVILHHIAIVFGGEGGFVIKVQTNNIVLSLALTVFLALNQSYFMGVFFTMSGYFSQKVLSRKSKFVFIKGRLTRLILPGMIYCLVINPIIRYIIDVFYLGVEPTFRIGFEALWFVMALGVFDIIYSIFIYGRFKLNKSIPRLKVGSITLILTGIVAWLIRIKFPVGTGFLGFQPGHFPQYIVAYLIGVISAKNDWVRYINHISLKKTICAIMILISIFLIGVGLTVVILKDIAPAFGGGNIVSLLYSIWEQMMYISFLLGLMRLFKMRFNTGGSVYNFFSKHAYLVYIVHSFAIVISVMVISQFTMGMGQMMTLTILFSMLGSILLAKILKSILKL